MRGAFSSLLLAALAAAAAGGDFVVRGIDDPRPDLLARALSADDGLLLLTGPLTPRRAFPAAVAEKAALAVQHAGHPDATAVATLDAGGSVVVEVVPGRRLVSGDVTVAGLPEDLAGDLRAWLKSPRPPADAVPQDVDAGGGWTGVRWLDRRGQPASLEPPLWSRGRPAPCDPHHLRDVRTAIARFLRDHGHFAAARGVEKPQVSGPRCDVRLAPSGDEAALAVEFADLPPAAVLREIELAPASRTSVATLCESLGIVIGGPVTEHDRLAWREALRATGRFLRHEVKFRETKSGSVPGVVAIFDLAAYPPVPPLGQPLSREEETILRCRSWLLATLADDDDLVASWTRGGETAPVGSLVVSTREGVLLTALPGDADASGIAASGGSLECLLPRGDGRLAVPLPIRTRAVIDVAVTLGDVVEQGRHRHPRGVVMAAAVEPRPRDATAAVAVTARVEPVACLSLLHEDGATSRWEDGRLVVGSGAVELHIDEASGRLLRVTCPDGTRIDVESGPGRLASALTALREAAGADCWQADAPISSTVRFLTSASLAGSLDRLSGATGIRTRLVAAATACAAVARNLRETTERGGFAAADRRAAESLARAAADTVSGLPPIPAAEPARATADPLMALAAAGASQAWRWLDRACGCTAWPSSLVRIATLAARHDSTGALWEATSFLSSPAHGPLANLAAATMMPHASLAVSFARQGQSRLSTAAFHGDCAAVLAVLRDCGLDHAGVAILRSLDDDEARAAGAACLRDTEAVLPLVRDLRACDTEAAAVASLPEALDRWWEESLHDVVAAALAARAGVLTAVTPEPEATPRR